MRKVVFMIDGWFMRKRIYRLNAFHYEGGEIRKYCQKHLRPGDKIYRIFYYDTEPLAEKGHRPISKTYVDFSTTKTAIGQQNLLNSIKSTPNFALRLGKTVWRNRSWTLSPLKLNRILDKKISIDELKPTDFSPMIEQKLVDMKIGIDITLIALKRLADVLIIITGDSDFVPALKLARREGMMVGLDPLGAKISPELSEHVDFIETKLDTKEA